MPFGAVLLYSRLRFYIIRFFQESTVKRSRVNDQKRVYLVLVSCKEITCSS